MTQDIVFRIHIHNANIRFCQHLQNIEDTDYLTENIFFLYNLQKTSLLLAFFVIAIIHQITVHVLLLKFPTTRSTLRNILPNVIYGIT